MRFKRIVHELKKLKIILKVFIFLDEKHLEKYQEIYELVRTVIDENGGECRC